MTQVTFRTCLAVLAGLVLTATGLWASAAGEQEPAAAMEKEMVMDPQLVRRLRSVHRRDSPEYGGTFTFANRGCGTTFYIDSWFGGFAGSTPALRRSSASLGGRSIGTYSTSRAATFLFLS